MALSLDVVSTTSQSVIIFQTQTFQNFTGNEGNERTDGIKIEEEQGRR